MVKFGNPCNLNMLPINTPSLNVSSGSMSLNTTYAFTVVVLSKDNRSGSRTVFASQTPGTAHVSITSTFTRFNPSAKLVLDSSISADYAANLTWSVFTALGVPFKTTPLTNISILYTGSHDFNTISFPFSVNGGTFSAGTAYTFQLTAFPTRDAANIAFSQITLTANYAPTSGYIISSPTNGSALVTQFTVSSPGWTTDAASFPLSYAFSYRVFGASINLTIAVSSLRPHTTTMLPSGTVTLQTQVTDIYLTVAVAVTNVIVTPAPALNVSHILHTSLATAYAVGDINLAIQTVNNVSVL